MNIWYHRPHRASYHPTKGPEDQFPPRTHWHCQGWVCKLCVGAYTSPLHWPTSSVARIRKHRTVIRLVARYSSGRTLSCGPQSDATSPDTQQARLSLRSSRLCNHPPTRQQPNLDGDAAWQQRLNAAEREQTAYTSLLRQPATLQADTGPVAALL